MRLVFSFLQEKIVLMGKGLIHEKITQKCNDQAT
jgi:hypothetical protein